MTYKLTEGRLYTVDVSGFIFRAYYALPAVTRQDGTPIGAVLGFCNMLMKLRKMIMENSSNPLWCGAFDVSRKSFRTDIFPAYKAHRQETPQELVPQFAIIKEAVAAFGLPVLEEPGFEADDVIASCAKIATASGLKTVVVSSDKDLMQLYSDSVSIFDPMKNKWISEDDVRAKFGVCPALVPDVQALAGDASDGIPGVPGVGLKTAAELINKFGSLEDLLSNVYALPKGKRRDLIIEHANAARFSKKLATLKDDVELTGLSPNSSGDIPQTFFDLACPSLLDGARKEILADFFQKQGFVELNRRLQTNCAA
ncbi:MAG: hypothetical protein LBF72_01590 [Holosporales bacterium]|jgi:DNA polymerase-1|nr:hypothetical protein [Holosporales bacterium]